MRARTGFAFPALALVVCGLGTVLVSTGFPALRSTREQHRRDVRDRHARFAVGRALAIVYEDPATIAVVDDEGRCVALNPSREIARGTVTVLPSGRVVVGPRLAGALVTVRIADHGGRRLVVWARRFTGAIYAVNVSTHLVARLPDGRLIYRLAQGGPQAARGDRHR